MPLPRLIALDLDGTLLQSDGRIGERSARAIAEVRRRGSEVVLCTGRPPRGVSGYAEQLDLPIAIVYHGASIVDFAGGTTRILHQLGAEIALGVLRRMRSLHPEVRCGLEAAHGWYLDESSFRRRFANGGADRPRPDGVGPPEAFLGDGAIKLLFRHDTRTVEELAAGIADLEVYRTWSGPGLLEVMHPQVNKRSALERFAGERGLQQSEVAAFGDQYNDREMLCWAGCGVAMANGSAEARAAADRITASNDEEGVAQLLERWLETDGG